jgi:hypothetical protein
MVTPATRTTAARLTTVFHASGCSFSLSILTARDCPLEVADGSLKVSAHAPADRESLGRAHEVLLAGPERPCSP